MQSAILEEMTKEAQGNQIMQSLNYRTYDWYIYIYIIYIYIPSLFWCCYNIGAARGDSCCHVNPYIFLWYVPVN